MTDDERMDRARRIREMREGSRPQDEAPTDDQPATPTDDPAEPADDSDSSPSGPAAANGDAADADREAANAVATEPADDTAVATDDVRDPADGSPDPAAADDGDGIHIPGADVEDVSVDVEEMARQAGLASTTGADADATTDDSPDDAGGESTVAGTIGRAAATEGESTEETRVLEFTLGSEQYCLDIEYVEEIVKRETVTRVPNTPDCVEGVVDLRGQITTILDPKVLLDIPDAGSKDLIVVFDPEEFDDQGAVGWVVDNVNQVTPINEDEVNDPPVDQDHVNGVVDRDGEFVIWTTPELDLDEVAG